MPRSHPLILRLVAAVVAITATSSDARATDPMADPPSWSTPAWNACCEAVHGWLAEVQPADEVRRQVEARWPQSEPPQLPDRLDHLIGTFALVHPDVQQWADGLAGMTDPQGAPPAPWLDGGTLPSLVRANCQLYFGRWATRHGLYDEAHRQLDSLTPDDVLDPATLLFCQAVARQRLLEKESALQCLATLLAGGDNVPRRYQAVAQLMQTDLEGLQDDSLDHIARRMDDVRRRLALGRANENVRKIEDGVIESLDKLIEKAEQQQQQGAAAAGAPSGNSPMQPAQDSRIMPGRGPGEVTKKDIGDEDGWGNMSPKQREAALQQIGREFPSHYRDVIEQYFRRQAAADRE